MATTEKTTSRLEGQQVLRKVFNSEDGSLTNASFLVGKVGRKVAQEITTTTVADDTETFTYSEDGETLYVIDIVYTDATRSTVLHSERVA